MSKKRNSREENALLISKTGRDRTRPRATVFDDGVGKSERRANRRLAERIAIENEMEEHEKLVEALEEEDIYSDWAEPWYYEEED